MRWMLLNLMLLGFFGCVAPIDPQGDAGPSEKTCPAEACDGKDNDCDGRIDNGACGSVAGKFCRLAGSIATGSCNEAEACSKNDKDIYLCAAFPLQNDQPRWVPLQEYMADCSEKREGAKRFWSGSHYTCEKCFDSWRWRKAGDIQCDRDSLIEWIP